TLPPSPTSTLFPYTTLFRSEFKETVVARARRDARFRDAMFAEAINAYLAGDTQTGKAMLRDLVNATIGFEALSAEVRTPSKSLRSEEHTSELQSPYDLVCRL